MHRAAALALLLASAAAPAAAQSASSTFSPSALPSTAPAGMQGSSPALPLFCPAAGNSLGAFTASFLYGGAFQSFRLPPFPPSAYTLYAQLWGGGGAAGESLPATGGGGAYVAGVLSPSLLGTASSLTVTVGTGGLNSVQTAGWGGH